MAIIVIGSQSGNTVNLTNNHIQHLQGLTNSGAYPEAYRYLRDISKDAASQSGLPRDELYKVSDWFDIASHINADDGSEWSEYVRGATAGSVEANGGSLSDQQFQDVSDQLARDVIGEVIRRGGIPPISDILGKDVTRAVDSLGLDPWQWAGTWGDAIRFGIDFQSVPISSEAWRKSIKSHASGFWRVVSPETWHAWRDATNPRQKDPLAIDLDGDGLETLGIPTDGSSPVLFDHDANGIRTGTGWLKADDARLVLDRDGNGRIDSGRELFGVDTVITETRLDNAGQPYTSTRRALSGFDALRSEDRGSGAGTPGAADGRFDALDAAFTQVRLWRDLDQDGISQAGELSTLAELGIQSISLAPTGGTTDLGNGNTLGERASVLRSNGSTTLAGAVGVGTDGVGNLTLADNPFYREFTDAIPLSEVARGLPQVGGGATPGRRAAANDSGVGARRQSAA